MRRSSTMGAVFMVGIAIAGMTVWLNAGDLNPPPGPIGPTMVSLDDLAQAINVASIDPADMVELGTSAIAAGATSDFLRISPTASNQGSFTVPADKVFVMTDLIILPESPNPGTLTVQIIQNSLAREFFRTVESEPTQLHFGTGLVFAEGFLLKIRNASPAGTTSFRTMATGYLADAP